MLRSLFFCLAFGGILAALPEPAAAAPGFGLRPRLDWMADPCLMTNLPGQVYLVFNPNQYAANDAYRDKTDALALRTALANAKISPGDSFAPVVDTIVADALNTVVEDERKNVPAQLLSILQSAADSRRTGALANNAARSLPSQPEAKRFWLAFFLERWMLFITVAFFLARRVLRYFREVEEEDDFADHLTTLARAHRWVFWVYMALLAAVAVMEFVRFGNFFFSLSVLFLSASLRRYYCEGHFADFPTAQKAHLAMRCLLIWLGWSLGYNHYLSNFSTWFHGPVFAWVLLALATAAFSQFYNHEDVAEHRRELYWFGFGFLSLGILGATGGYFFWRSATQYDFPLWKCLGIGTLITCAPLAVYFKRWSKKVSEGVGGRMIYDMIFSENLFAEKPRKKKRLPEILLLQHWRDHGEVEKAWQTAQSHLFKEARALSVWLFAMETGILYRRKPDDALKILKTLCATEEFHYDHRTVAISQVQGWMAAAGFRFDPAPFKIERPPLAPSAMTNQVEALCRAGRFADAEKLLREILANDSLNESAFTQLVRLYAQDLKNRPAAEKMITEAADTFSPKLLEFLKNSLAEWMQAPIRSQAKPRTLLDRLLRRQMPETTSRKLALQSLPTPVTPKTQDPLDVHLERLKQAQAQRRPDTSATYDPVEKMLLERRLGSAVELLQQQAEAAPANFELWLRYAEAHGHHCGQVATAEKIIKRMERSGHFKKAQLKKAHTQLRKWHKKHPLRQAGW